MPYIRKERRPPLDKALEAIIQELDKDATKPDFLASDIVYIIFKIIKKFYKDSSWYNKMDAIKACDSAMDEFRRRYLHPYEDFAILRNGDIS